MNKRFKLSALSLALLSYNMQAYAAEEESKEKEQEEDVEVIEIKGFRGSLAKSINDKRFSKNIADTINAEDVGKNADQNIADALGRVTGVSIVSRDGEGAQVTIRGASSQQNNITLNGQQLTSTDFSQAVDLSSFSADILSRLEVVKTSSADHDEGSLGGSVNLVTIRPLNRDATRTGEIQGRFNDLAEEEDYKVQFTVTEKFLDDTLGVAFTAYNETNHIRRDQYRVDNFVESLDFLAATDQNGNVLNNVRGITHSATMYELIRNNTDRTGMTLGLQWLPGDATEVMFDVTYSQQDYEQTLDGLRTRLGSSAGFVEGELNVPNYSKNAEYTSPFTDNFADWIGIDTNTNTLTKNVGRFGQGDITRSDGGDKQSNLSTTLDIKHSFTDELEMSVKLGYSRSKSDSIPDNAYTNMQNFHQVPSPLLFRAGENVVPVGYDCSAGNCEIVAGNTVSNLGTHVSSEGYVDDEGIARAGWWDNTNVLTGFNPADSKTFHLGFISTKDVTVQDELANAQIDFDWYADLGPITTLEFGVKLSQREKFVDNQNYRFSSSNQTAVFEDPQTGEKFIIQAGGLADIRANLIARDEGLGVDDFMQTLGYESNYITNGFVPIDIKAARDLILSAEDTVYNVDNTETRKTNLDTQALYLKTNFELLDGRLTGDFGVRYVRTEVETEGFAGMSKFTHRDFNLGREFEYKDLINLRNKSLPECYDVGGRELGYEKKFSRVDGLGWDTSSGTDPSQWTKIPAQGACHDPLYADWFEVKSADPSAVVYPDDWADASLRGADLPAIGWDTMWRYARIDGSHFNEFGDASLQSAPWVLDPNAAINANDTVAFVPNEVRDTSVLSIPTKGTHTYTNLLPSLNLNYAFSDELVGRFAVSKTMTRPEIDQLRPGFSMNQNTYWSGTDSNVGSKLTMFNTKLEPLESNNIDISLEWYFNPTSMLSVAIYQKDMKNFTDTVNDLYYIRDFTKDEGPVDSSTLKLARATLEDEDDALLQDCLSLIGVADYPFNTSTPHALTNNYDLLCDTYNVAEYVNGDGAKITGIELGYSQTYDFLPGFLSGLGVSANYTYQKSQYDTDYADAEKTIKLPEYPVADTPEHTYNFTTFWEQDGNQIRLSYRGTTDTLVGIDWNTGLNGRTWNQGSLWNEGRDSLDLSATYKVNDNVSISFQAVNLLDSEYRQYFTSRTLPVEKIAADNELGYTYAEYNEGNPLEGEAPKSRTYVNYKTGTTYRLGVRVNF
ncbi:TonB-dependent receptor (plasmid) [Catenovulum sp. SX2]|uniref:TonB-dependent receptor n=1 Tax=Catenovulum sp. SX2 TaxID=3398614 RepID=UPI003F85EA20